MNRGCWRLTSGEFAAAVAFYSIIHLPSAELPLAFAEFHRVLAPGAPVLLAFHVGDDVRHVDELLEQPVDVDFHFRQPADVTRPLLQAGLILVAGSRRT